VRSQKAGERVLAGLQKHYGRLQLTKVAGNARCWWHNSRLELNRIMPIAHFDRLGVPRLS
jgi:hypothetical protein